MCPVHQCEVYLHHSATDLWNCPVLQNWNSREFPGGLAVRTCISTAGGVSSTPGQATKISPATRPSQKNQKQTTPPETLYTQMLMKLFRVTVSTDQWGPGTVWILTLGWNSHLWRRERRGVNRGRSLFLPLCSSKAGLITNKATANSFTEMPTCPRTCRDYSHYVQLWTCSWPSLPDYPFLTS